MDGDTRNRRGGPDCRRSCEFGDRLMEHSAVRRRAQKRDQARQRGLRGQVRLGRQRRGASRPACGQTQARVMAERIRIVLVPPALAEKEKRRAQQIGKRIDDPIALAGIMKPTDHPLDDPRALHDLAKHDGPRFPGQPLGAGFGAKGLVERGTEQR